MLIPWPKAMFYVLLCFIIQYLHIKIEILYTYLIYWAETICDGTGIAGQYIIK